MIVSVIHLKYLCLKKYPRAGKFGESVTRWRPRFLQMQKSKIFEWAILKFETLLYQRLTCCKYAFSIPQTFDERGCLFGK